MLDAGLIEATSSTTEKVGLPNWSTVSVLTSAKAVVADSDHTAAAAYLSDLTNAVCKEQVVNITNALNMWAGMETGPLAPALQTPWPVLTQPVERIEIVYSLTENIALPGDKGQNSSVNILASAKYTCLPGDEIAGFAYVIGVVRDQMLQKRDQVLQNPRPWSS